MTSAPTNELQQHSNTSQKLKCEGTEDAFDFNPTQQYGFLSTHSAERIHRGWWQMVTYDGWNPLFHIVYKFKDGE